LWRTCQLSLLGDWEPFLGTWPKWGTMRNGESWERTTPEPLTGGSGSGLWPTPRAGKTTDETEEAWKARQEEGKVATPPLSLAVKMWPTPNAPNGGQMLPRDAVQKGEAFYHKGRKCQTTLQQAVKLWPTPTQDAIFERKKKYAQGGTPLSMAVQKEEAEIMAEVKNEAAMYWEAQTWPTPTAGDAKGLGNRNLERSKAHAGTSLTDAVRGGQAPRRQGVGGKLNPTWVEWLMGWPLGWTDCEPLEMDKFHRWLDSHKFS